MIGRSSLCQLDQYHYCPARLTTCIPHSQTGQVWNTWVLLGYPCKCQTLWRLDIAQIHAMVTGRDMHTFLILLQCTRSLQGTNKHLCRDKATLATMPSWLRHLDQKAEKGT